jgi:hypothetical protein
MCPMFAEIVVTAGEMKIAIAYVKNLLRVYVPHLLAAIVAVLCFLGNDAGL